MNARLVLASQLALSIVVATSSATADERDTCATASEQAQTLKLGGKLVEASEQLVICTRPVCPKVVRHDCEQLASDIAQAEPSITIDARDADGHDLTDVKVSVDDVVVTEHLSGSAIAVNPGPHVMRYEIAGAQPIVENVIIREGQKLRVLEVRFPAPPPSAPPSPPSAPPKPVDEAHHPSPSALVYVLGGVGVVSLGAFTVLALSGQSRFDDCAASHACSSSTKSSLGTERGIAWTTLGLGVVSLAAAGVLYWKF